MIKKTLKKIFLSIVLMITVIFFAVGCINDGSDSSASSPATPPISADSTGSNGNAGANGSDENGGKWTGDVELPPVSGK